MQKIILTVCIALVLTTLHTSAQNVVYDANAQVRKVGHFTKIHVSSAITLYLSQGNSDAVAVSAGEDRYTNRIRTEVIDGVLKIYVENGVWNGWNWGNRNLRAYVTVQELNGLEASGASTVKISDGLKVSDLDIEVSGASTFKCESGITAGSRVSVELTGASNMTTSIKAQDLKFVLSGASQANIEGASSDMYVDASGASDFKGYGFQTESCRAEASGASSIDITVNKKLDAEASGASSIGYKGEAVITNLDVSGSSNVKKRS